MARRTAYRRLTMLTAMTIAVYVVICHLYVDGYGKYRFHWSDSSKLEQHRLLNSNKPDNLRGTTQQLHAIPATELTRGHNKHTVNVLIIAGARTGSSFVGHFFHSHPEVFYLYEPLRLFVGSMLSTRMSAIGPGQLRELYDCDFSGHVSLWDKYFIRLLHSHDDKLSPAMKTCAPLLSRDNFQECCQSARYRVAKVVRLYDIRDLIPMMVNPMINLKVINIVRDPRAMMSSFIEMHYSKWKGNSPEVGTIYDIGHFTERCTDKFKQYCENMLRNYVLFTEKISDAWKENFMMVRFEDIAYNPLKYAKLMYSHAGIEIDDEVMEWIENNTHSDTQTHGGYGTNRNSSNVVNDWRHRVTFGFAELIQNNTICADFMDALHYRFAQNATMFKDDNIPLFTPSEAAQTLTRNDLFIS